MSQRILIIGRNGQLAHELNRTTADDLILEAHGRDTFDLAATDMIAQRIQDIRPDAVINAAAYTAVDKAESEEKAALLLNRDAPEALAKACADIDVPLVHVSTDYVFDGKKGRPYLETDPLNPIGVYGRTKALGEQAVMAAGGRVAVIRTSWVYSSHGVNFLKTMLRLAAPRDEIGVVADQFGRPTWAHDLANACTTVVRRMLDKDANAQGIFHYAGAGDASWATFAEHIFANAQSRPLPTARVKHITTEEFPTPVTRPADSRLDTQKFETTFNTATRDWRVACDLCMSEIPRPD